MDLTGILESFEHFGKLSGCSSFIENTFPGRWNLVNRNRSKSITMFVDLIREELLDRVREGQDVECCQELAVAIDKMARAFKRVLHSKGEFLGIEEDDFTSNIHWKLFGKQKHQKAPLQTVKDLENWLKRVFKNELLDMQRKVDRRRQREPVSIDQPISGGDGSATIAEVVSGEDGRDEIELEDESRDACRLFEEFLNGYIASSTPGRMRTRTRYARIFREYCFFKDYEEIAAEESEGLNRGTYDTIISRMGKEFKSFLKNRLD